MLNFKNIKFNVSFDERTGFVTEIINREDKHQMNWVLSESAWGKVDGFKVQDIAVGENRIVVSAIGDTIDSQGLSLKIERTLSDEAYSERYIFKNETQTDYFITQETFGIHFPFFSMFIPGISLEEQIYKNCIAHAFCGYNSCWLCGKKIDGSTDARIRKRFSLIQTGTYRFRLHLICLQFGAAQAILIDQLHKL